MTHKCSFPNCDGTRLGHELAVDFPEETERVTEALRRLTHPEDYANPMRETTWTDERDWA